jgi:RNA polymerase II C-terminal domain phosphatase-like 3/4
MRVTVTPKDEEVLVGLMARERPRSTVVAAGGDVVTVGGGGGAADGSDGDSSGSLQEISADDFKESSTAGASGGGALGSSAAAATARSRTWVAPHLGYMSRSYAPAFHSFAWAQAVQKKPLVPAAADDDGEVEHAVDASDEEMEEGEIEEGEAVETTSSSLLQREQPETIDLDSDAPEKLESVVAEGSGNAMTTVEEEVDFDQRVGSILEELEMVSIEEAEKYDMFYHSDHAFGRQPLIWLLRNRLVLLYCRSFEGACTRLRTCFESLKPLFPEDGSLMPMLEPLVQQTFVAIDTIITVRPLCLAGFLARIDASHLSHRSRWLIRITCRGGSRTRTCY